MVRLLAGFSSEWMGEPPTARRAARFGRILSGSASARSPQDPLREAEHIAKPTQVSALAKRHGYNLRVCTGA